MCNKGEKALSVNQNNKPINGKDKLIAKNGGIRTPMTF
jgi:hypothetical protein